MQKLRPYIYHGLTWLFIISAALVTGQSNGNENIVDRFLGAFNYFAIFLSVFYLFYAFLVPKFLIKGHYWFFGFCVFLSILFYPFLYLGLNQLLYVSLPSYIESRTFEIEFYAHYLIQSVVAILPSTAVRYAVYGEESRRKANDIEHQKAKAELRAVKAQANPHFLFNALNTIYALSVKNDPRQPDIILKLAGIMRYIMDYSQKEEADVIEEVQLIEDYLEIQQLRLDDKFDLQFTVKGETEGKTIIPMLFLPLVENCFKHGDLSPCGFIYLHLKMDDEQLIFETQNKIENGNGSNGEGLANLTKQLDLHYKRNYQFWTKKEENTFKTHLNIPVNGHKIRHHRGRTIGQGNAGELYQGS